MKCLLADVPSLKDGKTLPVFGHAGIRTVWELSVCSYAYQTTRIEKAIIDMKANAVGKPVLDSVWILHRYHPPLPLPLPLRLAPFAATSCRTK